MGMPLELNTMIVTKGREVRLGDNVYTLVKEGYRLYPLQIPIEVKTTINGELIGIALIKKVEWENEATKITYQF